MVRNLPRAGEAAAPRVGSVGLLPPAPGSCSTSGSSSCPALLCPSAGSWLSLESKVFSYKDL